MSQETMETLNQQTLIGYTEKRGNAWHYRAESQGDESNHYEGAIPIEDVVRRLFNWEAVEGTITATHIGEDGVISSTDSTRKAIMRSDTGAILGVPKMAYKIHGYQEWLLRQVQNLLDADVQVGSAGLLSGGAVAWVQVELADTMEAGGVQYRPFMTAATSLDSSLATTYIMGSQVVVCDNTLSCALGSAKSQFKVRHTSGSIGLLNDARSALGIVHNVGAEFAREVEKLQSISVTDKQWAEFVDRLSTKDAVTGEVSAAGKRKQAELNDLYSNDLRVAPWAGTGWGVMAAVNTYTHHLQTVRGGSRAERNMERVITGGIDKLDRATFDLLMSVI
jgi:phage/plasmid-like protein (TIGR03299 family)